MALLTKEKNGSEKTAADKNIAEKTRPKKTNMDHDDKSKTASTERVKALGLALDSIKKQYGDGSIMRLGDSRHGSVEVVPTGALSLDVALWVLVVSLAAELLKYTDQSHLVRTHVGSAHCGRNPEIGRNRSNSRCRACDGPRIRPCPGS